MLKVELHSHTSSDPHDFVPHSSQALIDRAAALGYSALAITLHDRQLDLEQLRDHARARGVVLIPGIERTIQGRHVLLINFPPVAARVASFGDLAGLRNAWPHGLVIAPHPFYPIRSALRGLLTRYAHLVDAVEYNALYTAELDFNAAAARWAERHGKPLVGNGDVHILDQLGPTYSLVDAEPTPDAICDAIRNGRVELQTTALSWPTAVATFARMVAGSLRRPMGVERHGWRQPEETAG